MDKNNSALMDANELAEYLRLDIQTVYRKTANGEIPSVKIGRSIRYRRSSIEKWLERQSKAIRKALKGGGQNESHKHGGRLLTA